MRKTGCGDFGVQGARSRRGSALVMAIVLSVVVSGLVMMIAWNAGGLAETSSNYARLDRAYFVAEGGAQRAYWLFKHNTGFRADPTGSPVTSALTGSLTVDGHTYTYTTTCSGASGQPVLVTSTATDGQSQGQVHETLTSSPPASTIALGGTISSTSQLIVTGNLISAGSISTSGTFTVNGNLTTGGTFGGGTVTGTTTTNASGVAASVPSVSSIYTQLTSGSYGTIAAGTVTSLDFTGHPVLFANGNVTLNLGTITGSGTLVVNGKFGSGNDVGTSSTYATLNVVCSSDFTANNKWYVNGSVYCGGNLIFNNQTVVNGVLVVTGNATMNNHHALNFATPPAFDARGNGLTATNFGGVAP